VNRLTSCPHDVILGIPFRFPSLVLSIAPGLGQQEPVRAWCDVHSGLARQLRFLALMINRGLTTPRKGAILGRMRKIYGLLLLLCLLIGSFSCAADCTEAELFSESQECQCCSLKVVVVKADKIAPAAASLTVVLLVSPTLLVEIPARPIFPIAFVHGLTAPGSAPYTGLFANRAPPLCA
jgi:hypothetical protein